LCAGQNSPYTGWHLRISLSIGDVASPTILRDEAKDVWGVVYDLPENELKHLDRDESIRPGRPYNPNAYTRENHHVWREGDANRRRLVSLYRGHPQPNPPLPDCDYKKLIVEGARHWQLPAEYIQELDSIETA
jgi:gamma-glutamylcyclotransferase (GGCT)/AIG2-like uncharacterized protein YtfP